MTLRPQGIYTYVNGSVHRRSFTRRQHQNGAWQKTHHTSGRGAARLPKRDVGRTHTQAPRANRPPWALAPTAPHIPRPRPTGWRGDRGRERRTLPYPGLHGRRCGETDQGLRSDPDTPQHHPTQHSPPHTAVIATSLGGSPHPCVLGCGSSGRDGPRQALNRDEGAPLILIVASRLGRAPRRSDNPRAPHGAKRRGEE